MKGEGAFRTISEVAQETGVAQHVLRYWETRFPQLRPLQRAGNRRYYRPADVALVQRINSLLNQQGYTVKGVQKLLADDASVPPAAAPPAASPADAAPAGDAAPLDPVAPAAGRDAALVAGIRAVRDALMLALAEDERGDIADQSLPG